MRSQQWSLDICYIIRETTISCIFHSLLLHSGYYLKYYLSFIRQLTGIEPSLEAKSQEASVSLLGTYCVWKCG